MTLVLASALAARAQQAPNYAEGGWHVLPGRERKLVAVLAGEVTAPKVKAQEWILYAPRAPQTQLSFTTRQFMWTGDPQRAATVVRAGADNRLFFYRGPASSSETTTIRFRVRYELVSRERKLSPGLRRDAVRIRDDDRKRYTQSDEVFQLEHPEFRAWLNRAGLVRAKGERDLAYGFRVLKALEKGFKYAFPPKSPGRACFEVAKDGASDCGGLSVLAVAALRAHQIPARLLVGRWVEAGKEPSEQQYHVKYEFFAEGVGWVPCDGSGAVTWRGGAQAAFGRTGGPFFVLHVDPELSLDSVHWGRKSVRFLQGVAWWVTGSGTTEGASVKTTWTVESSR